MCCSVLQCVAVCCTAIFNPTIFSPTKKDLSRSAVCCGVVLRYVVACCSDIRECHHWCSVLQCVAVCCSVLQWYLRMPFNDATSQWVYQGQQCVAVCCSVLQCVAVCYSDIREWRPTMRHPNAAYALTHSFSFSLSLSLSLSFSQVAAFGSYVHHKRGYICARTHILSLTHTHSLSLSFFLSSFLCLSQVANSLFHHKKDYMCARTHTLYLTCTHTLSLSFSLSFSLRLPTLCCTSNSQTSNSQKRLQVYSNSLTRSHTHCLSLSFSLSLSPSLSGGRLWVLRATHQRVNFALVCSRHPLLVCEIYTNLYTYEIYIYYK